MSAIERAIEKTGRCPLHPSVLCSLHDSWCSEPRCAGPCDCSRPRREAEHEAYDRQHGQAPPLPAPCPGRVQVEPDREVVGHGYMAEDRPRLAVECPLLCGWDSGVAERAEPITLADLTALQAAHDKRVAPMTEPTADNVPDTAASPQPGIVEPVYVTFDGPPGPDAPRFVDTHTRDGCGWGHPSVGWEERDGYWHLGPFYPPPQPQTFTVNADDGAALIAAERRRQVQQEGWTPGHDAEHEGGELALAAAVYALPPGRRGQRAVPHPGNNGDRGDAWRFVPSDWPWDPEWYKPTSGHRVRELVKAGALIAAEIDRLQARAAALAEADGDH